MMEAFPVSVVPWEGEPVTVRRGGRIKRCSNTTLWYADWHDQPRGRHVHHAQDIFAPMGSLVVAPNAGRVREVRPGTSRGGHSLFLEVLDARGRVVRTYYMAHLMEAPVVEPGEIVQAGQVLGLLGRSGNARNTCPHLHIGARRYARGRAVNIYDELQRLNPTGPRGQEVLPRGKPPLVPRSSSPQSSPSCSPERTHDATDPS